MNIEIIGNTSAVAISPVKAKYNDAVEASYLQVKIADDNLKDYARLSWALINATGIVYLTGDEYINGTDYTDWGGDNNFPFTFCAAKLNVTLV